MEIKKISADLIYQNSMERTANRPTEASRFGRGGMNPSQVKANYDQLALRAIEKVNEIISAVNEDGEESLAAIMKTPITDPDNDQVSLTLYDVLKGISNGEIAEYLKLNGLLEDTLLEELKRLEIWSGEQRDLAAKDVFDMIKDDPNFKGKDAYEAAKEGGYLGSEEEFYKKLAQESNISVTSVNGKTGAVLLDHEDVGADKSGAAAGAVSEHNVDDESHNDIRLELKRVADRINDALDSDDTTLDELHEIVTYIKSNKTLIDAITTSKVNVDDIINNLVSNVANKPLSAAQGVVLKSLVDEAKLFITPQMFGAKGDGVADDTAAIQAALDAGSVVFIPDGTYRIDAFTTKANRYTHGGIKPKSNQTIILSNNAVLKAIENLNGHYNIITITGVENVHIKGGKVQGIRTDPTAPDPAYGTDYQEYGYGVNITNSHNITVEQMEVFDCWGDSICIGHGGVENSTNIKVLNCVLHHSRRQGISVVGCMNALIQGCKIYDIGGTAPQYGIDIEPDHMGIGLAKDIVIDACDIRNCARGSILVTRYETHQTHTESIKITNCNVDVLTCHYGEGIVIGNCNVGDLRLGTTYPVRIADSVIGRVYLYGGTGYFDHCEIVTEADEYLIFSSGDGFPTNISNAYFYNCHLATPDYASTKYLIFAGTGDATRYPEDVIAFVNCAIELGANCYWSQRFAGKETRLDGCKVVYHWDAYELFTGHNTLANRFVIRNTEIECNGTPSYIFSIGSNSVADIEVTHSKLPNATNFVYGGNGSSGAVRLFNNQMANTNFYGNGTFETYILNDVKAAIPTKTSQLQNDSGYLTTETDPNVPAWAKAASKPSYTKSEVGLGNVDNVRQYSAGNPPPYPVTSVNGKTGAVLLDHTNVDADKSGAAESAVSDHNVDDEAHNDMRLELQRIGDRLQDVLDSDDATLDEMHEIVSYIKSNKALIDDVTTVKVNVADIINNLTTNVANKPLSAAQGVALKKLIDSITVPTKVSELENDLGYLTSIPAAYVTEEELAAKGYLTSVPAAYVTETELTAKGYLTLSTLPKYNGGVS